MPRPHRSPAEDFLAQFEQANLFQHPMVQALSGAEQGQVFNQLGNIGSVLRSLYERGGFSRGPEYFRDPQVLAQRARMFMGRPHPLMPGTLDLRDALARAQAARTPAPAPPAAAAPAARAALNYQPLGDVIGDLIRMREPWLVSRDMGAR